MVEHSPLWIDGTEVDTQDRWEIRNPWHHEVIGTVAVAGKAETERALDAGTCSATTMSGLPA